MMTRILEMMPKVGVLKEWMVVVGMMMIPTHWGDTHCRVPETDGWRNFDQTPHLRRDWKVEREMENAGPLTDCDVDEVVCPEDQLDAYDH